MDQQYPYQGPWGYEGPDCPGTIAEDSLRVPTSGMPRGPSLATPEPEHHMSHPLVGRVWRVCVALGPIIAIALTLAAGRRWF
jgi:hypothetical protein